MKYIKEHKEFLNVMFNHGSKSYDDFKDNIDKFLLKYNKYLSFKSGYFRTDYKKDIEELKKCFDKIDEDLDFLINYYKSKIYKDDFFTERCGFLDVLLYTYDNDYMLSGDKIHNYGECDEVVIKYQYNYEKYDMGKKFILQSYDTVEDYYFDCAEKFVNALNESEFWVKNINKKEKTFSITDRLDNGSICIIDLKKYYNYCESLTKYDFHKCLKEYLPKPKYATGRCFKYNFYQYNSKEDDILIVGFGDNLRYNDIESASKNIDKYMEEIEFKSNIKNYNL